MDKLALWGGGPCYKTEEDSEFELSHITTVEVPTGKKTEGPDFWTLGLQTDKGLVAVRLTLEQVKKLNVLFRDSLIDYCGVSLIGEDFK